MSTHTIYTQYTIFNILSNFNGSNTFGTLKISSIQLLFEPMRIDHSARSGCLIRIALIFYNIKVCCVFSLRRF